MSILKVNNVYKSYALQAGFFSNTDKRVQALENVSCNVEKGDYFGIVGQSGSGKSTLTRVILGLDSYDTGSIEYSPLGIDPCNCETSQLQAYRDEVKLVFQDPSRSLNPRVKVGAQFITSMWNTRHLKDMKKNERYDFIYEKSRDLLQKIGLSEDVMQRYPSYFSGGQRQRLAIVRALIHSPKLLICDEITASLDASTHRALLEMLLELKSSLNFTIVFIAHDISLVFYFCNSLAVMENGHIVETGKSHDILKNPKTSASQQLLEATPRLKYK